MEEGREGCRLEMRKGDRGGRCVRAGGMMQKGEVAAIRGLSEDELGVVDVALRVGIALGGNDDPREEEVEFL